MSEAETLYKKGQAAEKAGKKEEALEFYRKSAIEDSSFRPAFLSLGSMYSEMGRHDLSLGFYKQALDLSEDTAACFNLAGESFRLEKYSDAEKYLVRALKLDRKMLRAHLLLAYIYGKLKNPERSEVYFKNVITLEKNNRLAHLGLAILKSENEKYEDALSIIENFLKTSPADESFQNMRGGLLLKLDRVDDSLGVFADLSKKSEKFTSFTSHLAEARNEANQEYEKFFSGAQDKIKEKNQQLKQKIEMRKKEARKAGDDEHKEDMKDLVDLSLLHLFSGDSEKALKYLFHAKKVNQSRKTKQ